VFYDAAFLNYARTLGGVVDEDDHERKLVTAVMLLHPTVRIRTAEPRVNTARRGRFAG
jgi:hypothetical protein